MTKEFSAALVKESVEKNGYKSIVVEQKLICNDTILVQHVGIHFLFEETIWETHCLVYWSTVNTYKLKWEWEWDYCPKKMFVCTEVGSVNAEP